MSVYFSPSLGGFVHSDIFDTIPQDAIELTDADYTKFLDDISNGKTIGVVNGQVVTSAPVIPVTWDDVRAKRDVLLQQCDWTQLADAALTTDLITEWRTYRQNLRNLPANFTDAASVVWPVPPGTPTV